MGNIETTYNLPQGLTTFNVVGKMWIADFYDGLERYYKGTLTPLVLWDLTETDLSAITTDEISDFAQDSRYLAEARKGGKTAIVFNSLHDFGLGRMLGSYLEIAGSPLEIHVFRSLDDARKWLGVEGILDCRQPVLLSSYPFYGQGL